MFTFTKATEEMDPPELLAIFFDKDFVFVFRDSVGQQRLPPSLMVIAEV